MCVSVCECECVCFECVSVSVCECVRVRVLYDPHTEPRGPRAGRSALRGPLWSPSARPLLGAQGPPGLA